MRIPILIMTVFAASLSFDLSPAEAKDCCLLKPCGKCNTCCSSSMRMSSNRSLHDDVLNALANRYQSGVIKVKAAERGGAAKDTSALDRLAAELRPYMTTPSTKSVGDRGAEKASDRDLMLLAGIAAKVLKMLKDNPDADGLELAESLIGQLLPFLNELKPSKPSKPAGGGSATNPDGNEGDSADNNSDTPPKGTSAEELTAQLKVLAMQLAKIADKANADREAAAKAAAEAKKAAAKAKAKETEDLKELTDQLEATKKALQDTVNAVSGAKVAPVP